MLNRYKYVRLHDDAELWIILMTCCFPEVRFSVDKWPMCLRRSQHYLTSLMKVFPNQVLNSYWVFTSIEL